MTIKYDNVYINETSTIVGPYEYNGPFGKLYDKHYKELCDKIDNEAKRTKKTKKY